MLIGSDSTIKEEMMEEHHEAQRVVLTDTLVDDLVQVTLASILLKVMKHFSISLLGSVGDLKLQLVPSANYTLQILNLSLQIAFAPISTDDSAQVVLDIRPFTEYSKQHARGATNVCLPLTLLKRANFTWQRCINSLPSTERAQLTQFFTLISSSPAPATIYLYDNCATSASVFYICQKLVNSPLVPDHCRIRVSGYDEVESHMRVTKDNSLQAASDKPRLNLPPLKIGDTSPMSAPYSARTPTLCNFALPKLPRATFKIRHNEELLTSRPGMLACLVLEKNTATLFRLTKLPLDATKLPKWLHRGTKRLDVLTGDFNTLEKGEQKRLIMALSLDHAQSQLSPLIGETPPQISLGFEYGHKNRYKDIFLYEHLRVKLGSASMDSDYINASYINPLLSIGDYTKMTETTRKQMSYIATQGPLDQTIGDFWKLVVVKKLPLIISLTDEIENGVLKCLPFWKSGVYYSNQDVLNVKRLESYLVLSLLQLRTFSVLLQSGHAPPVTRLVLQVHLLSWPDMGTVLSPHELIEVVKLKHHVLGNINISDVDYPLVIHCLAGCGRTGTLCTIDTVLSIMMENRLIDLPQDPILDIVDNFRRQRILMVQNLRQYYLVYDTVLEFLAEPECGNDLSSLKIVNDYINGFMEML